MKNLFIEHFTEILALVGGSLLPLLFKTSKNIVLGKAKTQADTIKDILTKNIALSQKVEQLQSEISNLTVEYERRLRELEVRYFEKNHALEREIDALRNQLILFESSHNDTPLPSWLTDDKNIVVWVNKVYEEQILSPSGIKPADIIGERIVDLMHASNKFTPEELEEYEENNNKVLKTGLPNYAIESIFVGDEKKQYFVVKYPRIFGRKIVGISGTGIPLDIINNLLNH